MSRCFPENAPHTTNLRWGIESILINHGVVAPKGRADLIEALEEYFINVVGLSSPNQIREDPPTALDVGALLENVRFEGE